MTFEERLEYVVRELGGIVRFSKSSHGITCMISTPPEVSVRGADISTSSDPMPTARQALFVAAAKHRCKLAAPRCIAYEVESKS